MKKLGLLTAGALVLIGVSPSLIALGGQEDCVGSASVSPDNKPANGPKLAFIPFGYVTVNLNESRLTRYLRVKLVLVVNSEQEKEITDVVEKNKPVLKNWLIQRVSDLTLEEVRGAQAINRLRREIAEQFNARLFQDRSEKIREVLFEELLVQ